MAGEGRGGRRRLEMPAAFTTDAEELEIEAVPSGRTTGLPTGVTAAAQMRPKHLVPPLTRTLRGRGAIAIGR